MSLAKQARVFRERPLLVARAGLEEAIATRMPTTVTRLFHHLYYRGEQWENQRWLGTRIEKCAFDLVIYQELIARIKPDLIIETGTNWGGSAHFMATLCDALDHGHVMTVDVSAPSDGPPAHDRITYLYGSSTSPEIVEQMTTAALAVERVLVILDSDHSRDHVLAELHAYAPLVTRDSYVIVEDSNINGHPAVPGWGPGPMEAIHDFLAGTTGFVIDKDCERFGLTQNPDGYLRRNTPRH